MFTPPKSYQFTPEQEKRVFNLIVKNTLDKKIVWDFGIAMLVGKSGNNKLLFYKGDNMAISIQNKSEYVHFFINQDQYDLLKQIIRGKNIKTITNEVKQLESANDYYEDMEIWLIQN